MTGKAPSVISISSRDDEFDSEFEDVELEEHELARLDGMWQ
jgi:hypothetical protein